MTSTIDIAHLRDWVGREQMAEQALEPFAAVAMSGLLGRAAPMAVGDALPLPWHWLYFLDAPARAATGVDGHPSADDIVHARVAIEVFEAAERAGRGAAEYRSKMVVLPVVVRARETLRRGAAPLSTQQQLS